MRQIDLRSRLPALLAMLGNDIGKDAATDIKLGRETHVAGFSGFHQVIENTVGDGLMETALVAKRPHVKLETLELDAVFFGHIVENQGGEVRLAGFRAQASELGNLHMDMKIPAWCRIGKGFQSFCG